MTSKKKISGPSFWVQNLYRLKPDLRFTKKKTNTWCVCVGFRSLETEHTLRMKAELESAEYKQKLQVVTCKYGQVQKELQVSRAIS